MFTTKSIDIDYRNSNNLHYYVNGWFNIPKSKNMTEQENHYYDLGKTEGDLFRSISEKGMS